MGRLRKFLHLPTAEKILFIEAFIFIAAMRVCLWIVPQRLLQNVFSSLLSPVTAAKEPDWTIINGIVRAVKSASRFVPFASCLPQAMAAMLLIRLNGQDSELKFGVAKDENARLIAHAWLEKNGCIIFGKLPEQVRFTALKLNSG